MNENRPNIITVGQAGGALGTLIAVVLAELQVISLGEAGTGALVMLCMFSAQYLDRVSKRSAEHVVRKYGPPSQDAEML
jgi:hypothetical protein